MQISKKLLRVATIGVVMSGAMGGAGQRVTIPSASQQSSDPMRNKPQNDSGPPPEILAKQGRARNDERQRRLVSDTDKLLALATSLHDDVAKTNKDILSLDVVKRADEIEKLAHSVKERMKG